MKKKPKQVKRPPGPTKRPPTTHSKVKGPARKSHVQPKKKAVSKAGSKKKKSATRNPKSTRSLGRRAPSKRAVSRPSTYKQSVSDNTLALVRRALDALVASSRFEFIKRLQAAELVVKIGDPGSLRDFTLEDLSALGADEVCRLPGISAEVLEALSEVIQGMAAVTPGANFESPGLMPGAAPNIDFPATQRSRYPTPDLPSFSSSEAELKLITLLGKLRSISTIAQFHDRKLGDFWHPEWPKAPFEQLMTVRQVLEINIDAVLKKRSFTGQKLSAFMQALERVAAEASGSARTTTSRERTPSAPSSMEKFSSVGLPSSVRFALMGVENSLLRLPDESSLRRTFCPLGAWITPSLATALVALLDEKGKGAFVPADPELLAIVKARAAQQIQELLATWVAVLAGPAVGTAAIPMLKQETPKQETDHGVDRGFEHGVDHSVDHGVDHGLQEMLLRLLLQAIGAKEVHFRDALVPDHWTLSPRSFSVLFQSFLDSLPRSDSEARAELRQLFPSVDPTVLDELLSKYAELNELDSWVCRRDATF